MLQQSSVFGQQNQVSRVDNPPEYSAFPLIPSRLMMAVQR
jgi:hypothetical protein